MSLVQIDAMVDFAIAQISGDPEGYRSVVRDLVIGWPDATGLQAVFALTSAVNAIERVYRDGEPSIGNTHGTLKMTALLSSDLFALEQMGKPGVTCREVLAYWSAEDQFFLNL